MLVRDDQLELVAGLAAAPPSPESPTSRKCFACFSAEPSPSCASTFASLSSAALELVDHLARRSSSVFLPSTDLPLAGFHRRRRSARPAPGTETPTGMM